MAKAIDGTKKHNGGKERMELKIGRRRRKINEKITTHERADGVVLKNKNKDELIYRNGHEFHFRAIISPNTIIDFRLKDLIDPDRFSIREILIPWLRKGNHPVLVGEWDK